MTYMKSPPGEDPIVVEGYYAASPARVFRAWTDPLIVKKWFGREPNSLDSASIDLQPGGRWSFMKLGEGDTSMGFEGRYLEIVQDEKLVFTWAHIVTHADGRRETSPDSTVAVDFVPKGSGTMVRVVHSSIRHEDARRGVGGGWEASFASLFDLLAA